MRRFFATVLFLCCFMCSASELPVTAIDYPPFTSPTSENDGLAFRLLREALDETAIDVTAKYWSPARAHRNVQEGKWCASFYPSMEPQPHEVLIALSEGTVKLGLFRERQAEPFAWKSLSDLSGKKVAYLRAIARDGIGKGMTEAGMEIFNVETIRQGMQLLIKGRVDYAFGDPLSGEILIKELGGDPADYQFSEVALRDLPVAIWLNLNCAEAKVAYECLLARGYKTVDRNKL